MSVMKVCPVYLSPSSLVTGHRPQSGGKAAPRRRGKKEDKITLSRFSPLGVKVADRFTTDLIAAVIV